MQLSFSRGNKSYLDQFQTLALLSYGQHQSALSPDSWSELHDILANPDTYTKLMESSASFICEADGELVGMAFLVSKGNPNDIFEAGWSYVRMVGVNPKYAGKGIGKKLSQMCIDYAIETHEDFIALHTSEFMDAARHVYENLGFKKLREIDTRFGKRYWIYILDLKGKQ